MDDKDGLVRDEALAVRLRAVLEVERTPASWLAAARAIPMQVPRERLLVVIFPHLAGAALLAGLAIALYLRRGLFVVDLSDFSLPVVPSRYLLLSVLPALVGLGIAESVRGFPVLRRWFT